VLSDLLYSILCGFPRRLETLGWTAKHGPDIALGEPGVERKDSDQDFLGAYQSETDPGAV
jgi:hypothetical protein